MQAVPRLYELYPGICLTTEEKAQKNLIQGSRRVPADFKNGSSPYSEMWLNSVVWYTFNDVSAKHISSIFWIQLWWRVKRKIIPYEVLVYEPEYEGPPDNWILSIKILKTERKNGCRDVKLTAHLHLVLKWRMSGSMAAFPHTPLCPVFQYGPVHHSVSFLCSFSYADLTVNTQRRGEMLHHTVNSTYCSSGCWMWRASFVAEFQDAVRIFTPDVIWISTRKSTVNFVRDVCSSHTSVDADSSSGIFRRIAW
jgi:hypothetical protein